MKSLSFLELEDLIIKWSTDRKIIQNSNSKTQMLKAMSELGELADAINKRDTAGIVDGLGDVIVCLINVAQIERIGRMKNFSKLEQLVINWATDRKIIQNSDSKTQMLKAMSELGELSAAINKRDRAGIVDGLCNVIVCLINVAQIEKIGSLVDCLDAAYNEIKDRKGYLNQYGVFIKE